MQKNTFSRYFILLTILMLFSVLSVAQDLPIFRIGILDNTSESVSRGARLAIERINRAGGVTGADGTNFQLELIIQSTTNMDNAINTLDLASVIAVIGPAENEIALGNLAALQSLNVPILTLAMDDTLLIQDTTERFIRVRSREATRGRALANYLLSDFEDTPVSTVQLDLESTAGQVGFSSAFNGAGGTITDEFLLEGDTSNSGFVEAVADSNTPVLIAYGAPDLAREFYTRLIATGWDGRFVYNRANHEDFKSGLSDEQLGGIMGATTWSYAANDDSSRAFVADYAALYDDVPDDIAAAAYDAVYMIDTAVSETGNLINNLNTIDSLDGVQGLLQPDLLPDGESSNQTMIFETTGYGGQAVVARYAGDIRLEDDILVEPDIVIATFTPTAAVTATPAPTSTPEGITLTVTRAVQNIRTGPGLEYDVIGQLNQGEQRPIVGANVNISWVAINYRGQVGWLSAGILDIFGNTNLIPILAIPPTPTPPPTAFPTSTPLPPAIADIVIT
ncbi:MAG: ABC transporter substrate-binding protein, partial [Aggregatilineales bacterium]